MFISLVRKCGAVCVCILAATQGLKAQAGIYHLSDLVDSAKINQPSILKKRALVSASTASIIDARHASLPLLKLHDQVSLASANGATGTFFPLGVIVPTAGAIRAENNYHPATGNIAMVYSEYELEDFGLKKAREEDAAVYSKLTRADLAKDIYLLQLETARYYFYLLKAYHQLNVEQNNIKRYETIAHIIDAVTTSGLKPGSDSSQAKAALSKAKANYNSAAGTVRQLKQELSLLTGIPEISLNIDTSILKSLPAIQINSKAVSANVALANPLLDYYANKKLLSVSRSNLIKKSFLPKILLVGGVWGRGTSIDNNDNYKSLSSGFGYQRFNYAVGLAFNYNIFDKIHRRDKLAINQFEIQQNEYELQEQRQQLDNSLQKAQTAIEVINTNLQEIQIQLSSAKDLYAQKSAQYQAGVSNLIDLANAAYVLYQAQTDMIQAQTDWFLANLDKAAANGSLEQFIQTLK